MNRMLALAVVVVSSYAAVSGCAPKTRPAPTTAPAAVEADPKPAAKTDAIQPGDLLHIYIPDLTPGRLTHKPMRVDERGEVALPHYGTMQLAGLSLSEAEAAINNGYQRFGLQGGRVSLDREESGRRPSLKTGPIAPGDVVRFQVRDLITPGQPTTLVLHVSASGELAVLGLGQFPIAGLTEIEAEKAIANAYAKANMIRDAQIQILRITPDQASRLRNAE